MFGMEDHLTSCISFFFFFPCISLLILEAEEFKSYSSFLYFLSSHIILAGACMQSATLVYFLGLVLSPHLPFFWEF